MSFGIIIVIRKNTELFPERRTKLRGQHLAEQSPLSRHTQWNYSTETLPLLFSPLHHKLNMGFPLLITVQQCLLDFSSVTNIRQLSTNNLLKKKCFLNVTGWRGKDIDLFCPVSGAYLSH